LWGHLRLGGKKVPLQAPKRRRGGLRTPLEKLRRKLCPPSEKDPELVTFVRKKPKKVGQDPSRGHVWGKDISQNTRKIQKLAKKKNQLEKGAPQDTAHVPSQIRGKLPRAP